MITSLRPSLCLSRSRVIPKRFKISKYAFHSTTERILLAKFRKPQFRGLTERVR